MNIDINIEGADDATLQDILDRLAGLSPLRSVRLDPPTAGFEVPTVCATTSIPDSPRVVLHPGRHQVGYIEVPPGEWADLAFEDCEKNDGCAQPSEPETNLGFATTGELLEEAHERLAAHASEAVLCHMETVFEHLGALELSYRPVDVIRTFSDGLD